MPRCYYHLGSIALGCCEVLLMPNAPLFVPLCAPCLFDVRRGVLKPRLVRDMFRLLVAAV